MNYPTIEQVLIFHDILIERFGGSKGIRDIKMLESAIFRSQMTFDGDELYPTAYKKAASLTHSIINNHPFVDGNKRTGIYTGIFFLKRNGYNLDIKKGEITKFAINIAKDKISIKTISEWFKDHTT